MKKIYGIALLMAFMMMGNVQAQQQIEDQNAIDELIAHFYEAISFNKTKAVDYAMIDAIYHPDAKVGIVAPNNFRNFIAKEFRERNKASFKKSNISSFQEKELKGLTHIYGGTATRFSTYQFVLMKDGNEMVVKGVNNMQLIKTPEEGWKIFSVIFSDNRAYPKLDPEMVK